MPLADLVAVRARSPEINSVDEAVSRAGAAVSDRKLNRSAFNTPANDLEAKVATFFSCVRAA